MRLPKVVLAYAALAVIVWGLLCVAPDPPLPPETVIVQDTLLLPQIIERQRDVVRWRDRIVEVEVQPDTIFIGDTVTVTEREELTRYCMLSCEKEDDRVWVDLLDGVTPKRYSWTLPRKDSDFDVLAGKSEPRLRADREWFVRPQLEVAGEVAVVGSPHVLRLSGPIAVAVRGGEIIPYASINTTGERAAGVTASWRFF